MQVLASSMTAALKERLLQLTVAVETAITDADYSAYRRYVAPGASFFEPRSRGSLLQVNKEASFHHQNGNTCKTKLNKK